jgi:hypothetical protein
VAHPHGRRIARSKALVQCGAAALVFLGAVVPFQWFCAEPFARTVITISAAVANLAGPQRHQVQTLDGRSLVFERRDALQEFYDDPEQRPHAYSVLAVCSWIAVAPLLAVGARVRLVARAVLVIAVIYAAALACSATAWYWRSIAAEIGPHAAPWTLEIGATDALGNALDMIALFVAPLLLGAAAYPGLDFEGRRHLLPPSPSRARSKKA